MARRFHREPGEPVGIVIAVRELVKGAFEPFARVWKLSVKFSGYFGAYFVAGLADAGAKRSDDIFRFRTELHLHTAQRFCRDATDCTAPAGMNRSNHLAPGICK